MEFKTQFKAARRVSTPLVAIRTFDAKSTTDAVRETLQITGSKGDAPVIMWDAVHGFRAMGEMSQPALGHILNGNEPDSSVDVNAALRYAENAPPDSILFFCNAHLFWSEPVSIQAIWNLRDIYKADGIMLVLLCAPGSTLPVELVNDTLVIDEPLPTESQLQNIVAELYTSAKVKGPDAETLAKATDALIGLPAFPAEQATAMCLDTKAGKLDTRELWERKRQIISQTPGCSINQSAETLSDVRGLASVVNFLRKRMAGKNPPKALLFQDEVEKAFAGSGTDLSGTKTELTGAYCSWFENEGAEGVTFIGLPGVSKSALAKALANEYGLPLIGFDIAAMQGSLVGQSGANFRAASKMVTAIAAGRLLVISTCNGIESVPPEIRRRIGSLGIFFFDEPTGDERADILTLYRAKYDIPATDAAPNMAGWTGAEIKECCRKAHIFGMTLLEASTYVVPVTLSSRERITALRLQSSGKYLSASKPGVYQYTETQTATAMPVIADGRKMREVN